MTAIFSCSYSFYDDKSSIWEWILALSWQWLSRDKLMSNPLIKAKRIALVLCLNGCRLVISHFCSSSKNVSLLSWKPGQLGKSRMLRMTVKYTTTVLLHSWNSKRSLKCLKRLHFKNGTGGGTNRTMDRPTDRREESLASDFSVLPIYQPKLVIRIFHHRKCLFIAKRNFINQRSKTC